MNILLLGSGPEVTVCRNWARAPFDRVVAINNAWRVRPDWDAVIHPFDFPRDRLPSAPGLGRRIVTEAEFVPAMNAFGGVVHVGATMAFTATCWVLHHYRPRLVAYLGCDMHYPPERTHFYGRGQADPLRPDVTLRSLEAKAARAMVLAAAKGTALVNLSRGPSRLVFPRATPAGVAAGPVPRPYDRAAAARALGREAALGYRVPSGRYWLEAERFDPRALAEIDALWLAAAVEPDRLAPAS